MWPFSSASSAFKKQQERDKQMLEELRRAAQQGDTTKLYGMVFTLYHKDPHLASPTAPPVWALQSVIMMLAEKDRAEAVRLAAYAMQQMPFKHDIEKIADKTLGLITQLDKTSPKEMATAAATAQVIITHAVEGGKAQQDAHAAWQSATKTLASLDIGMAFAAASNAALSQKTETHPLSRNGVNTWNTLLDQLSATDKQAAKAEAERVARGYKNFGERAHNFRMAAFFKLGKLGGV